MFEPEFLLAAGERGIDRLLQRRERRVRPLGQLMVLDVAEQPLGVVEFRAVGRQIVQVDAPRPQRGQRLLHVQAAVEAGVVQGDHQRARTRGGHEQEAEQVVGREMVPRATPVQGWGRARPRIEDQGVVAPPLRVLVGHSLALPRPDPAIGYRLARGEAALIEVGELELARRLPFFRCANTRSARSTRAGSCLCRSERTVRRQRAPSAWRYLRVCRVLSRMPSSGNATASRVAARRLHRSTLGRGEMYSDHASLYKPTGATCLAQYLGRLS